MIKEYTHNCVGTCSRLVTITYDDETHLINEVKFLGGCPGNTKGVSKLCVGRKLEDVYEILNGTMCGNRGTSCPNELSKGINKILKNS